MCGRFALNETASQLAEHFTLSGEPDLFASWNIAPSMRISVIREAGARERELGGRHLVRMRWGLIPSWAKDATISNKLANARGETVAEKPSFRSAFRHRRCIIPASGFYEWMAGKGVKQPWFVSFKSGEPMALAGIWETWQPEAGEAIESCCIITTAANSLMEPIHDRMPVILDREQWKVWLGPDLILPPARRGESVREPEIRVSHAMDLPLQGGNADGLVRLLHMIRPHDSDSMRAWPVTREVNRVGLRDDAGLTELLHPGE